MIPRIPLVVSAWILLAPLIVFPDAIIADNARIEEVHKMDKTATTNGTHLHHHLLHQHQQQQRYLRTKTERQLLDTLPPPAAITSRIVGGSAAPLGAYPGFAYWDQGCGASLITSQIALSAAHCYVGHPGTIYVNSVTRATGDAFDVDYVRIHPNFNGNRDDPDWDFMILKLKQPVPATVATPVLLNQDPAIPQWQGEVVTAVGFGRLEEGAKSDSNSLQRVSIPFVESAVCAQAYNNVRINEATLCAGRDGMDACQGDSGGPLYLGSLDLGKVQVGIVSWGVGCARPGLPGVYARISTGYPWIQAQACIQADDPPADFCEGASIPIDLTLQVDIRLDDAALEGSTSTTSRISNAKMTWGLYAIDQTTTLYETELDDDVGVIIENANSATSISVGTSRKKEDDEKEENNNEQQQNTQDTGNNDEILAPNQVKLEWDNLSPGKYYFQLRNPLGTGLGNNAENHVWIIQGGRRRVVTVPHGFGSFFDAYFDVTADHLVTEIRQQYRPAVASSPETPMVEIMLDVMYDENAPNISWELRNLSTNEVLAVIASGTIATPKYESYVYNVKRGHTYQVTIRNSAGQGLSDGWISVWVGLDMLWKSNQATAASIPTGATAPPFAFELTKAFQV